MCTLMDVKISKKVYYLVVRYWILEVIELKTEREIHEISKKGHIIELVNIFIQQLTVGKDMVKRNKCTIV